MQCELCGTETDELTTIQTEGTKLQVCSNCTDFGTVLQEETSSTGSQGGTQSSSSNQTQKKKPNPQKSNPRSDAFDQMETLAPDYDDRVRGARESSGLTQEDLAKQLNEKASLIRKIEGGDMQPDEEVRKKLERALEISLVEEVGGEEWEGGGSSEGYTLGDIIERKE